MIIYIEQEGTIIIGEYTQQNSEDFTIYTILGEQLYAIDGSLICSRGIRPFTEQEDGTKTWL